MIRMIRWGLRVLYRMGTHLAQAVGVCLQLAYFLLTLLSGFTAQLALMAQVAEWCQMSSMMPNPEALLIGLPMEWRVGTWRLLAFYGAFVWLGYILPAQQQHNRKSRRKKGNPYWAASCHALTWAIIWGLLGLHFGFYTDVAAPVIAIIMGGLAGTYYLYVWQGLIVPRLQDRANQEFRARHHLATARAAR